MCSLPWCDARARRHSFDFGIVASTTPANRMPLCSNSVFILGSAWLYLMLASIGLSSGLKPFSSSWHTATTSPIKPRPAVSAAGVLGLCVVQWRRSAAMTGVAAGLSRSRFPTKLEELSVAEIQRDRVAAVGHARP